MNLDKEKFFKKVGSWGWVPQIHLAYWYGNAWKFKTKILIIGHYLCIFSNPSCFISYARRRPMLNITPNQNKFLKSSLVNICLLPCTYKKGHLKALQIFAEF